MSLTQIKPRERFLIQGERNMTIEELLAIILRNGTKTASVHQIVEDLVRTFPTMYALRNATITELQAIKGVGQTRAIELKAIIEFGRRVQLGNQEKYGKITSSYQFAHEMMEHMRDLRQEHLICVYLNTKNEILLQETVFIGSLNQSIAHPREIFKGAVRQSAARILLVHNHPSGDPTPSSQDYEFTARVKSCGELMGIFLLDHVIVGENKYISLKEEGNV